MERNAARIRSINWLCGFDDLNFSENQEDKLNFWEKQKGWKLSSAETRFQLFCHCHI